MGIIPKVAESIKGEKIMECMYAYNGIWNCVDKFVLICVFIVIILGIVLLFSDIKRLWRKKQKEQCEHKHIIYHCNDCGKEW